MPFFNRYASAGAKLRRPIHAPAGDARVSTSAEGVQLKLYFNDW
ncbi:MAG: hypothetical protein R3E50_03925 [Halioglobus sp.]